MDNIKTNDLMKLSQVGTNAKPATTKKLDGNDFSQLLKKSINELNQAQESSDKALADMATGQVKDLHQAAIAIGKAETSMKLMLEVRNKAISAYKEILRTQI